MELSQEFQHDLLLVIVALLFLLFSTGFAVSDSTPAPQGPVIVT